MSRCRQSYVTDKSVEETGGMWSSDARVRYLFLFAALKCNLELLLLKVYLVTGQTCQRGISVTSANQVGVESEHVANVGSCNSIDTPEKRSQGVCFKHYPDLSPL